MSGRGKRKHQMNAIIDNTLKQVDASIKTLSELWAKLEQASKRDKIEDGIKTEVRKLQKHRENIRSWIANGDSKDVSQLEQYRRLIETEMERLQAQQRGTEWKGHQTVDSRAWIHKAAMRQQKQMDTIKWQLSTAASKLNSTKARRGQKHQYQASQKFHVDPEMLDIKERLRCALNKLSLDITSNNLTDEQVGKICKERSKIEKLISMGTNADESEFDDTDESTDTYENIDDDTYVDDDTSFLYNSGKWIEDLIEKLELYADGFFDDNESQSEEEPDVRESSSTLSNKEADAQGTKRIAEVPETIKLILGDIQAKPAPPQTQEPIKKQEVVPKQQSNPDKPKIQQKPPVKQEDKKPKMPARLTTRQTLYDFTKRIIVPETQEPAVAMTKQLIPSSHKSSLFVPAQPMLLSRLFSFKNNEYISQYDSSFYFRQQQSLYDNIKRETTAQDMKDGFSFIRTLPDDLTPSASDCVLFNYYFSSKYNPSGDILFEEYIHKLSRLFLLQRNYCLYKPEDFWIITNESQFDWVDGKDKEMFLFDSDKSDPEFHNSLEEAPEVPSPTIMEDAGDIASLVNERLEKLKSWKTTQEDKSALAGYFVIVDNSLTKRGLKTTLRHSDLEYLK